MKAQIATKKTSIRKPHVVVPAEIYMNSSHLDEFKSRISLMLEACTSELAQAHEGGIEDQEPTADDADRSDQRMEMENRARNIERLVHAKREIDAALRRINSGDFGYCEETGDEIGLARLRANPLARFTIDVQSRHEHLGRLRYDAS